MFVLLSPIELHYTLGYFENTIIFCRNADEHIWHVRSVLSLLQKAGVTLILKECSFILKEIDYLQHVIQPGKLDLPDYITDPICYLRPSCNITELKSLVKLGHLYRQLVPNFALIAAPFNKKLRRVN